MRLNPIVATLGTNALLYGAVFWYTGGIPRTTTARLARLGGGLWLGIPIPVYFAVVATLVVTAVVKLTPAGRRFEGVGANADRRAHGRDPGATPRTGAYVWAQLLYCLAAVLHAAHRQPADLARGRQLPSARPSQQWCSAAPRCSAVAATSLRP